MGEKKADLAYNLIKNNIISGKYPPKSDILEDTLQKELGFSRTPVREALIQLKNEGFIVVFPKKGTIVSPITQELINEVYEMRLTCEPYLCVKASSIIPVSILEKFKSVLVNPPKFANEKEERDFYIKTDASLHNTILQCSNNSFMINAMQLIYAHNDRFRNFTSRPKFDNSIDEHIELIDSILSKDEAKIMASSIRHINTSKKLATEKFLSSNVENMLNDSALSDISNIFNNTKF